RLVRNARPEGHEAIGLHRHRAAVEHIIHAARGQPVKLDMPVAMGLCHDLGRKGADAEAAKSLSRRIETAVRAWGGARGSFPARGRGGDGLSHTNPTRS